MVQWSQKTNRQAGRNNPIARARGGATRLPAGHRADTVTGVAGDIENLILAHLREVRTDMGDVKADIRELTSRVGAVERGLAEVRLEVAHVHLALAELSTRTDRLTDRMARLERRSDPVERAGAAPSRQYSSVIMICAGMPRPPP